MASCNHPAGLQRPRGRCRRLACLNDLVPMSLGTLASLGEPALPALVERAGDAARFVWDEFFRAQHHNRHTQKSHLIGGAAVPGLGGWVRCRPDPYHVRHGRRLPGRAGRLPCQAESAPGRVTRLSRRPDATARLVLKPAASVRGVKDQVIERKTPAITIDQARKLLASIDAMHAIGLRDRAILAMMGMIRGRPRCAGVVVRHVRTPRGRPASAPGSMAPAPA